MSDSSEDPSAPTPEELAAAVPRDQYGEPIRFRAVAARPPWRELWEGDDVVHIVPPLDPILHSTKGDDCVCGPTAMLAPGHEGHDHADIWVHQHHALDGRPLPNLR